MNRYAKIAALLVLALPATPAAAQQQGEPGVIAEGPPKTVFDGDFLTVGVGAAYGPSYSGSDDYTAFVLPIVQGSLGGIDISPRPGGLASARARRYRSTRPARPAWPHRWPPPLRQRLRPLSGRGRPWP